jgi:hypothetical protein
MFSCFAESTLQIERKKDRMMSRKYPTGLMDWDELFIQLNTSKYETAQFI